MTKLDPSEWPRVWDNELTVYGQVQEHSAHCVFMFLSLGQILRDGGRVVPKQMEYEHIKHCTEMLLDMVLSQERALKIGTIAPRIEYNQTC